MFYSEFHSIHNMLDFGYNALRFASSSQEMSIVNDENSRLWINAHSEPSWKILSLRVYRGRDNSCTKVLRAYPAYRKIFIMSFFIEAAHLIKSRSYSQR